MRTVTMTYLDSQVAGLFFPPTLLQKPAKDDICLSCLPDLEIAGVRLTFCEECLHAKQEYQSSDPFWQLWLSAYPLQKLQVAGGVH